MNMMQQALEEQESLLRREKQETLTAQRLLTEAQKDLEEKNSLLRYFESSFNDNGGGGDGLADQRAVMAEQERDRLKIEMDRLTAMVRTLH